MTMTGKELDKLLQENDWVIERIASSHHILVKDGKHITVTVHSGKSVPTGLLNAILKQAGLK